MVQVYLCTFCCFWEVVESESFFCFRHLPINGLGELVVWQPGNVFDYLQLGLFIMKWRRVPFLRCIINHIYMFVIDAVV